MNTGMKSYPSSQHVFTDLGDKVLDAISRSVDGAAADLRTYRAQHPDWVAQHSERGLASWIHDRIWHHFVRLAEHIDDVHIRDREPIREISVGIRYRLRMKRHHEDGQVSAYPTQGSMDFMEQDGQGTIEGLEEVRLIAGYEWDRDSRGMDAAVLSLRDGKDKIIWRESLPEVAAVREGATVGRPTAPVPSRPTVEARDRRKGEKGEDVPG